MKWIPRNYQEFAAWHMYDNPYCGLFLDMGLGKTVVALTVLRKLLRERKTKRILVIAPKRVASNVWTDEAEKWDHLQGLTFSKILGTEKQRKEALKKKADIYLINRENVVWLVAQYRGHFPFDTLVIDELSSFKSAKSARFKALRRIRPHIDKVVGLTGTPSPNGLIDLWPQMYLLDTGERLGSTLGEYRRKYFVEGRKSGDIVLNYKLKGKEGYAPKLAAALGDDFAERNIHHKISDICISMKTEDYLELPKRIDNIIKIEFSNKVMNLYREFEKTLVLQLDEDEVTAQNAMSLSIKLQQYANGAIYTDKARRNYAEVHKEKIYELGELLELANGKPTLVFYSFRHDAERIMRQLKMYKPHVLDKDSDIKDWNAGRIRTLLAHPASAGHGLNMQFGGHLVTWFGNTWSEEIFQQANKRVHRSGQEHNCIFNHLSVAGTIDELMTARRGTKKEVQDALMNAVKAMIRKHKNSEDTLTPVRRLVPKRHIA
jgi:SNF2 family DNA or RNA helicase